MSTRFGQNNRLDEIEGLEEHDFITYFIEDMEAYGKSDSTLSEYERVLRDFDGFLEENGKHHSNVSRRDCMQYISSLRRRDLSKSSIATYASYLHRFYSYLVKADEFPHTNNPMGLVMEEMNEKIDKNPQRRELSVKEVIDFLKTVNHPRDRCMILTLFKTGMRSGELANLRLSDISLDEDKNKEFGIGANSLLSQDSIYVSSDLDGNKRMRDTLIPVDAELKREIKRWLRVRPDKGEKLFIPLSSNGGKRLSSEAVGKIMRKYTEPYGWWEKGARLEENVTPHYCRHFFTTYLREESGDDGLVKYLRGDVSGDIIETYTHQWGDKVREKYETYIYRLV